MDVVHTLLNGEMQRVRDFEQTLQLITEKKLSQEHAEQAQFRKQQLGRDIDDKFDEG